MHIMEGPKWITAPDFCIILHIIQKLNPIVFLFCIQNISEKFLTSFLNPNNYLLLDFFQNICLFLIRVSEYEQTFFTDTRQKADGIH